MQNEFMGSVSEQFEFEDFKISLVKYIHPVSEEWHSHPQLYLSLVLGGGNMEVRKNEDLSVFPGMVLQYNKEEKHRNTHARFPSSTLNIEIKDSFFEKNDLAYTQFQSSYLKNPNLRLSFLKIFRELQLGDISSSDSIESILLNALVEIRDEKSSAIPPWLNRLDQILSDRWNEFISLNELSQELNLHPVTISKSFPIYFDCTLSDYMRKIKTYKAVCELMNTRKSVAEIAYQCGFSDQSHFNRVFKSYTGYTPYEYRNL